LLAIVLHTRSGTLGFSVDSEDVEDVLSGRFESPHFIIHYTPSLEMSERIETIADDHEFRRAQLVRDLGVDPPGKITSYFFANADQKARLMGAKNVYMAKPWRHEIYINDKEFPHPVLRHEIAHVMAGAFGDPIFEVSAGRVLGIPVYFNVGLIEGTAVAADWPDHFNKPLTPHQSVKAMLELGMPQPVGRLFSTGFLSLSSARSYTLAGSYLRFLLDRYGVERLQAVYRSGGDFVAAYGKSMAALTGEWRDVIEATVLPEGAAQVIRERFRHKAIFNRPCPHAIARARDSMAEDVAEGDVASAIATARNVCSQVPAEPRYQLSLASLLQHDGKDSEATEIYRRIASDSESISASLRAKALFELASVAMDEHDREKALASLEQVLALPLSDDDRRRGEVMREVLTHGGPAATILQAIFWHGRGKEVDRILLVGLAAEAALLEPNYALPQYLMARQIRGRGSPEATVRVLQRVLALPISPLVERESARLLAESAYLAGQFDVLAEAAAILVRADQPEVTRLQGYDWLERSQWAQAGSVPARPLGWRDGATQSGAPE